MILALDSCADAAILDASFSCRLIVRNTKSENYMVIVASRVDCGMSIIIFT